MRSARAREVQPSEILMGRVYGIRMADQNSVLCQEWMADKNASPGKRAQRSVKDHVPAYVRNKRPIRALRDSTSSLHSLVTDEGGCQSSPLEYYVQYLGFDHRLDEWVEEGRIDVESGPFPDSKRRSLERQLLQQTLVAGGGSHSSQFGASQSSIYVGTPSTLYVKNVNQVTILGRDTRWELKAWYFSPYGEECIDERTESIYVCEYCLRAFKSRKTLENTHECALKEPPGRVVYREPCVEGVCWEIESGTGTIQSPVSSPLQKRERNGASPAGSAGGNVNGTRGGKTMRPLSISVYEVNGRGALPAKLYCQNLSLLAKLFLEHKSVIREVDGFLFYVLCVQTDSGQHMVGYFSKEKHSKEKHSLACLFVLPCYQCVGFGKFLISLSYELARREGNLEGTPEKPLSDVAQLTYKRYWSYAIMRLLLPRNQEDFTVEKDFVPDPNKLNIERIQRRTGINRGDIAMTLEDLLETVEGDETLPSSPLSQGWGSPPKKKRPLAKLPNWPLNATIKKYASDKFYEVKDRFKICKNQYFT